MKEIFDYINGNSFLTTIIGVVVGGLMSAFTAIYISNKEKKDRRYEESLKEQSIQFAKKPELKIMKVLTENDNNPTIEVFLAPFEVKYFNSNKKYEMHYPKNILNKKNITIKTFI